MIDCPKCGGSDLDIHPTKDGYLQCLECGKVIKFPTGKR